MTFYFSATTLPLLVEGCRAGGVLLRDLHPQPHYPRADLSPGQEVPRCGTDSQVPQEPPGLPGFPRVGMRQQLRELGQLHPFPGRRHLGLLRGRVPVSAQVWSHLSSSWCYGLSWAAGSLRALPLSFLTPFVRGPAFLFSRGSQSPRLCSWEGVASSTGRVEAQEAVAGGQARGLE